MKCIISCTDKSTAWVRQYFPGTTPGLLRFGNKPYLEFLLDFCYICGIREVRIVSEGLSQELSAHLGNGAACGLEVTYATTTPDSPLPRILEKNQAFRKDDDILLFAGMQWLNYQKNSPPSLNISPDQAVGAKVSGQAAWYLIGRDHHGDFTAECQPGDLIDSRKIDSIQDFFAINQDLVNRTSGNYNLPGYGDRVNFIIGRNVEIPRTAHIRTPVIIGNSVQFSDYTLIGPGVIIGDNVIVDDKTNLKDTIIMGNSYVGAYSELKRKIVYRNFVIDPDSGVALDIVDDFLLTELVREGYWQCSLKQRLMALFLLVGMGISFLLLRPWIKIKADWVECIMNQQRKAKLPLRLYLSPAKSAACRYFRKLSLDRYHLLPLVIRGKLRLVGSRILEVNDSNEEILRQFPDYAPGIVSYSEYLGSEKDPFQRDIDELYYIYHASFSLNIKILCGIWFRNFMKTT